MLHMKTYLGIWLLLICCVVSISAQQAAPASANAVVPHVIKFSGVLTDASSKPLSGIVGVTFSLYKESQGGPALWVETQNATLDKAGHYSVMLGSTTSQGMPSDVFSSGEARWLGVQVHGQDEQPRTILMSVPYALKALDAETIGGLPASAFVKAAAAGSPAVSNSSHAPAGIGGGGTTGHLAKWTGTSSLGNSNIFDGAAGNVGIATTSPTARLDVDGTARIRGNTTVNGSVSAGPINASTNSSQAAVTGTDNSSAGAGGIVGGSQNGVGVRGTGVVGLSGSGEGIDGYGVYAGGNTGVFGSGNAVGVYGTSTSSTGVIGTSTNYFGVYGSGTTGVYGSSATGVGVEGVSMTASAGVYGTSNGGWALDGYGTAGATGVLTGSDFGWAAWFNGDVQVDGNLSKSGGSFKIDHPLDPANKYLYHSFVESPDMKNIYDGNVTTNAEGEAVVTLPEWFETLNRDFRYQLTAIGQFAQAMVSHEIADGRFSIKTDKPNVKVSWQVTGIRQDPWANAHRIPVEQVKPGNERGSYLHPELYGASEEKGVLWARDPKAMKQWKAARTNSAVNPPAVNQKEASTKP
jgi:hypothetical protein